MTTVVKNQEGSGGDTVVPSWLLMSRLRLLLYLRLLMSLVLGLRLGGVVADKLTTLVYVLLSVVVNLGTCVLMTSSGTRQQSLTRGVATTSILMGGHFYKWGVFSVSMH